MLDPHLWKILLLSLVIGSFANFQASATVAPATRVKPVSQPVLAQTYGKLPLSFEANQGQAESSVRFLARGPGYTLLLTEREAVLGLFPKAAAQAKDKIRPEGKVLKLRLKRSGAEARPDVIGEDVLPGKVNYLLGKDTTKHHTGIPTYRKVKYRGVYPGIDLVFYGNPQQLEHDFIVAPGADPKAIRFEVGGATPKLQANGDLVLALAESEVVLQKPVVYQDVAGRRERIDGHYVLYPAVKDARPEIGFELAAYDRHHPLVIDPVLVYSTYLGGGDASNNGSEHESGAGIAVDADGNAYVTGYTESASFPVTPEAAYTVKTGAGYDGFVTKFNASGTAALYSTYLGGQGDDEGHGIAVDGAGNAYIAGYTASGDFPTTAGAAYTHLSGVNSAFVAKLNATGTALVYSAYLGGSGYQHATAIAVDGAGNAYVTGETASSDFPVTLGAAYSNAPGYLDAFVTKINAAGSALVYSSYLGGIEEDAGKGIAVDGDGNAYITGRTYSVDFPLSQNAPDQDCESGGAPIPCTDAFVAKLNAAGTALVYSTYLGGSGWDFGYGIAVDGNGSAYVTGFTGSENFPVTPGAIPYTLSSSDAFVSKLNPAGTTLTYSSCIGGSAWEYGFGIAVDGTGNAYVTGVTASTDFPVTQDALQSVLQGSDAFVAKFDADGKALVYATYLGGLDADEGNAIAVDGAGNAYVTGTTASTDFPSSQDAPYTSLTTGVDAFVTKLAKGGGGVSIQSIDPNAFRNHGLADSTIKGSGFVKNATTVKLAMAGEADITPLVPADVVDGNTLTAGFDLTGKKAGKWDVIVTNPDGSSARLQQGFTVTSVSELTLNINGQGSVAISGPAGIDSCTSSCVLRFDGESVTLTLAATPGSGNAFTGWSEAGCIGSGPCTVILTGAHNVAATFAVADNKADMLIFPVTVLANSAEQNQINSSTNINAVPAGGLFTYNIRVKNFGPATATNVTLTQTLDLTRVDFVSANAGCTFASEGNPARVTCNFGDLAPMTSSEALVVKVRAKSSVLGGFSTISAVTAEQSDPDQDNNTRFVDVTVVTPPPEKKADVGIASVTMSTDSPEQNQENKKTKVNAVPTGEQFTFQVKVKNYGPAPATSVVLSQTLNSKVDFVSANGSCDLSNTQTSQPILTCKIGSLAKGKSTTRVIRLQAKDSALGSFTTTSAVSADQLDPDTNDNSRSVDVTLLPLTVNVTNTLVRPGASTGSTGTGSYNRDQVPLQADGGTITFTYSGLQLDNDQYDWVVYREGSHTAYSRLKVNNIRRKAGTVTMPAPNFPGTYNIGLMPADGDEVQPLEGLNRVRVGRPFNYASTYTELDYGLYWFKNSNDGLKAVPGQNDEYFSPAKPTIIYVHGWQKNTVIDSFRETFLVRSYPVKNGPAPTIDLMKDWKAKGYNVGIFYWNQFADDDESGLIPIPYIAETKIWGTTGDKSAGEPGQGMSWRYKPSANGCLDGGVLDNGTCWVWKPEFANRSVADLFYEDYVTNFKDIAPPEIRIVGHSLGNQLAVRTMAMVLDDAPANVPRPTRIALLDPAYTGSTNLPRYTNARGFDVNWGQNRPAELVASFLQKLIRANVACEVYQTSPLQDGLDGQGANAHQVYDLCAYQRINPNWLDDLGLNSTEEWPSALHFEAKRWYFESKKIGHHLQAYTEAGKITRFLWPISAWESDDHIKRYNCGFANANSIGQGEKSDIFFMQPYAKDKKAATKGQKSMKIQDDKFVANMRDTRNSCSL